MHGPPVQGVIMTRSAVLCYAPQHENIFGLIISETAKLVGKCVLAIKDVFNFSVQLLFETFFILLSIWRVML